VVVLMSFVLTFVMVKIIPEFRQIFWEFELELPPLTELLIAFTSTFGTSLAILAFPLVALTGAAALLIVIFYLSDQPVLQPVFDRTMWSRRVVEVLRLVALGLERRVDPAVTLAQIATSSGSGLVRRRTGQVAQDIEAGEHWIDA